VAILELATFATPPSVPFLRKEADDATSKYVFSNLFQRIAVDSAGKTIGRMPNVHSTDAEEREAAIEAKMFETARLHRDVIVSTRIAPALNQIREEHAMGHGFIEQFVWHNSFVPPGRERFFVDGLLAGYNGNSLLAAHLLIPQIENSIRHLIMTAGATASGFDSDGIQDERPLKVTLGLPQARVLLGEDLCFDLRGILIERFGENLRNRVCHGLMPEGEWWSPQPLYLWCLVLRMVISAHLGGANDSAT
jgi:hypothetical protein